MCGRFTLISDVNTIARVFHVAPTLQAVPRYNIAPTQEVMTIMHNGTPHLAMLRWGLIPPGQRKQASGQN